MCLIVILHNVIEGTPVLVAANREEAYDRQGTTPQRWTGDEPFVAGRDPLGGGTWLGVNAAGVLVGVTNRPAIVPPDARSRGLLCRDLLASPSAESARRTAAAELSRRPYAGCNLLAVDREQAFVVHFAGTPNVVSLEPGVHVLARGDVDDTSDRRIARALQWVQNDHSTRATGTARSPVARWLAQLQNLCMDHGDKLSPPICLHAGDRGTISSSLIAISEQRNERIWLHAQGPPCSNDYTDCSQLLRQLGA